MYCESRNTLKMVYDRKCIRQNSSKRVLNSLYKVFDNIGGKHYSKVFMALKFTKVLGKSSRNV